MTAAQVTAFILLGLFTAGICLLWAGASLIEKLREKRTRERMYRTLGWKPGFWRNK